MGKLGGKIKLAPGGTTRLGRAIAQLLQREDTHDIVNRGSVATEVGPRIRANTISPYPRSTRMADAFGKFKRRQVRRVFVASGLTKL
jgi:hypothetical protein